MQWRKNQPELLEIDGPIVARGFSGRVLGGVKGDKDRPSTVEGHGRKVLVKVRLEHDDLVTFFEECGEHGVLACIHVSEASPSSHDQTNHLRSRRW